MFKILIQGRTIEELRANYELFNNELNRRVSISNPLIPEPAMLDEEEQEDFLTEAAAQPSSPTIPLGLPAESESMSAVSKNDIDSKGMPWDARIHASSRAVTAKGSWRYRRNVEDSTIYKVEQELIAALKGAPVTLPPTPAIPAAPIHHVAVSPAQAPVQQVVPSVPVVPPAPVAPPQMPRPEPALPSAHTVETFKKLLVPTLADLVKKGKLTQEYVNQLTQHFGVDAIHKVNDQQAEEMFHNFIQYGMIAKAE